MASTSLVLTLGLVAVPVLDVATAPEAAAVPGQPGVMESPSFFYFENFENITWQEPDEAGTGSNENDWDAGDFVQTLTDFPYGAAGTEANYQPGYTNVDGLTYSADQDWAAGNFCNGIIVAAHGTISYQANTFDSPRPQSWPDPLLNPTDGCIPTGAQADNTWFNRLRSMARAMGEWHQNAKYPYLGIVPADTPDDNHIVSSYTNVGTGQTIEPGSMLEFDQPLPVDPGRYYQFSVDVASQSCNVSGAVGAEPQFLVTQADGTSISAFSEPVDTCVVARDAEYGMVVPGVGATNQSRQTRIGTWLGDTALRSTGDSIGIQILNEQESGAGNDTAFDNITILDTTPKLDKQFSASPLPVGADATLTYTVTNTYDPLVDENTPSGPKEDFSFTDVFNDGDLQLTGTSSTTCGDGTVTTDVATGTVSLTGGDLVGTNLVTCTVTVGVTSDVAGTYTNGPDDFTDLFGLAEPGSTDITFEERPAVQCPAAAQLWQFVTEPPTTVYDVDLVTGDFVDRGHVPQFGVNGVGFNALDGQNYGALVPGQSTNPPELIRTSVDLQTQENLGQPDFSGVDFDVDDLVSTAFNIGDVSPDGIWYGSTTQGGLASWIAVDVDPLSPTFMDVVAGDPSYGTTAANLVSGADWSWHDGLLYSVGYNTNQNPRTTVLFSLDPSTGTASTQVVAPYGIITAPDGVNPSNSAGIGAQWGATYMDDAGYMYASNNGTGQIWRFNLNAPAQPPTFFSYGPASTGNDGSRCPSPVPVDLGDAPTGYGTTYDADGARHGIVSFDSTAGTAPLMLGSRVDAETDGAPSAGADGDDTADVADEDGVAVPLSVLVGEAPSIPVTATNDSTEDATLVAWFDADLDGTFDPGEASTAITVPAGSGSAAYTVELPAADSVGTTYLRVRLFAGANAAPEPTGTWSGGEVEDYLVEVVDLPLDLGDAPDTYGTTIAADGARHGVVDYDEDTNTAPLMLGDSDTVDVEDDGAPSAGADGDDSADVDDEGGVSEPVTALLGQDLTLDVTATNDSTTDATLVAWLDADLDGVFDAGEASTAVTVPAGSGVATYPVTVPGPEVGGETYLRVRLFAGANAAPLPTGLWVGGEVEDYQVTVLEPELTIVKSAGDLTEVIPGQEVEYTITVENTGDIAYTDENPAAISDELSDVLDDAVLDESSIAVTPDVGELDYTEPDLTWSGPLAVGETVTITYTVTVLDPDTTDGNRDLYNTVVGPPESNCDPNSVPADPRCTVELPDRALHIEKSAAPEGPVAPGDVVTYTITAENTGFVDYEAPELASFEDDLTDVLDDAAFGTSSAQVDGVDRGELTLDGSTLSWEGELAPGEVVTVTYTVTVADPVSGDGVLDNVVTGPTESNCDPLSDPADPLCSTSTPVADYEVVKTVSSPEGVAVGDQVEYTLVVTNTGGAAYTADEPATVEDDLTGVLDDATWDDALVVTPDQGTAAFDGTTLTWAGPLGVGESVTITYSLTVAEPGDGDGVMVNAVTGGQCPDPAVTDEDDPAFDPDCVTRTPVLVPGLDITKTSDAGATVLPGDTVSYTITVENTGDVAYTAENPATLTDDLTGVLDDAAFGGDAVASAGTATFTAPNLTWTGPIPVGGTVTITYTVTIDEAVTGDAVVENVVTGPPGSNCDPEADPSDPDCSTSTPVRSLRIVKSSSGVDPSVPVSAGDVVAYTITVENTGAVAYAAPDLASMVDDMTSVLDDAEYQLDAAVTSDNADVGTLSYTAPELTWSGPLEPGEVATITYTVVVDDPITGDGILTNTVTGPPESNCDPEQDPADPACTVTIPAPIADLTVLKEVDVSQAEPGDVVTYSVVVTNTGEVPYSASNPVVLADDLTDVLDDADYLGGAVTSPAGVGEFEFASPTLTWTGPLDVGDSVTLTYAVTVHDPADGDGVMDNVVTGPPESNCDPEADPSDPDCATSTPVRSVALSKSTTSDDDPVVPGSVVTYTVVVENTGAVAYEAPDLLEVSDDLAAVLDDATLDETSFAVTSSAGGTPPVPVLDGTSWTWSGPLAVDEIVTITYQVEVDDPSDGDLSLVNVVTGPPESNCDPEQDPADPECTTTTPVQAASVVKTSDAEGSVVPGQVVEYSVTITSTGTAPYTEDSPASFEDDLSGVLDDATLDEASVTVTPDQGEATVSGTTLTWSGPLEAGTPVTVTYTVTVDDPPEGDGVLLNAVTGAQCPDPAVTDPEAEGYDPDCVVELPVRALEIVKTSDPTDAVVVGEVVTYTVTVTNTGGFAYVDPDLATFEDDLSEVLDDAQYGNDAAASTGAVVYDEPFLSWSGELAPGAVATITYSVTVDDPVTGDGTLTNAVTGPPEANCPDPAITDPEAEGYDPDCSTQVPTLTPALAIAKSADTAGPVLPGDVVTYTVTVENTGQVAYTELAPASFQDDLSEVLDDATADPTSVAVTPDQGTALLVGSTLTWSGPLAVGESVAVTYTVTVDDPLTGDGSLVNVVTGPPESNCDPEQDPADPDCTVTVPVRSLAIAKTSDAPGQVLPGGDVTYTVTVTNTGGAAYTADDPATIEDDLSAVLDDAVLDESSVAVDPDQGEATVDGTTLTWSGPLDPGDAVEITYTVTVADPVSGDGVLDNVVTGPPESNCDPEQDPADPDCTVTVPVRSLAVAKAADVAVADLGDTVTYTLTVTNTGGVAYTEGDPAAIFDDLAEVLDDAAFGTISTTATPPTPATSDAEFDGDSVQWSGPLAVGQTVEIVYTVVVADPATGDQVLDNTVVGPPESPCDPAQDPADPECTVTVPVRSLEIVKTSDAQDGVELGDQIGYTITITNTGEGAYTEDDPASFADDLSEVLDDATFDEDSIVVSPDQGAAAFDGTSLAWSGPLDPDATVTVTYSFTVNDPASGDRVLTNAVTGPPEANCPDPAVTDPEAEGYDPDCSTQVPTLERELRIAKAVDVDEALPGDVVTYTVTVENTGEVAYTATDPASFTDDLSAVLDDATLDGTSITTTPPQGSVTVLATTLSWSGPLAVGESVEVSYAVTVDAPPTGDGLLDNVVTGPPESNCDPEADPSDPECSTSTPVRALTIVKTGEELEGPLEPGQTVDYQIVVTNSGQVDYTEDAPAWLDDDLTEVLDDATFDESSVALSPDQGSTTYTEPVLRWEGPLAVGESVTITYSVTVSSPITGDAELLNTVQGPPESTCADPTAPGCFVIEPERTLELTKTADPDGAVRPGETVTYTITITNPGQAAYTDEFPAVVVDDLAAVLDDAVYNDDGAVDPDAGEVVFAPDYDALVWVGPLAGGATVTLTYSVTVDDPLTGDGILTNVVFDPTEPPECTEGVCGPVPKGPPECVDGVDPATGGPCGTTETPVKGLGIEKTASTPDEQGWAGATQDVTYEVTVTNTGAFAYTDDEPAVVTDDMSDVLDDATLDAASVAVDPDQGEATVDGTTLTWSGPLGLGESVTITYTVTVDDPPSGDGSLVNTVTGPPESNCLEGGEDGCTTTTPVRALDIVKTSDAGDEVSPGDTVGYTVVVTNTGTFVYTDDEPAVITDDMSDVLDDATYRDDVAVSPDQGAASFDDPELTWSGPLAPGESVTLTYSVTVTGDGDANLLNVVTGPPESTCAADPSMSAPFGAGPQVGTLTLPALLAENNPNCSTEVPVVDPPVPAPPTAAPPTTPLPRTGAEVLGLVGLAAAMLLVGAVITAGVRRMRGRETP
ncbi:DUF7927 domain-containing protein [Sediminihabitans luteus]|uniref:DUF7927 domain-containing protein n=1 Tax=Sediminihabitans luteus TaxID=1138585 RepID=UPI0012FDF9BB|nr:GEVED domain-containing protein [Sediminihabitans luteus]